MGRLRLQLLLLCATCIFACGCETVTKIIGPKDEHVDEAADGAVWIDPVPRVRKGVVVLVQVGAGSAQPVQMRAQVDQNGEITLPYLLQEPVLCEGLTLEALKQKLIKCYQVFIKQPQITVNFGEFDIKSGVSPWGTVTVLGEVVMPGPVNMPPTQDLTVTKVLQLAGGLKPFARKDRIRVTSCGKDGSKTCTIVDLNEIGEKGLIGKDIPLRAGNVVWVPVSWY